MARASSGSRSRINSVEPMISANSAVIVLRSPSAGSAPAPDSSLKIFCASGDPRGRAGSGDRRGFRRGVPHSPQNLNCGGFSAPQFGQTASSGRPQLPQNLVVSGFSELQLGQRISPTPSSCLELLSTMIRDGGVMGTLETACADSMAESEVWIVARNQVTPPDGSFGFRPPYTAPKSRDAAFP